MKWLWLRNHFFAFMLVLIVIFLCYLNYTPGTWLSGWDTLHPEFNFSLNLKRTLFGVWREDQGLGALAGHSHMADLPRIAFLYLTSFVLPIDFLRYFYFFICLILGPLGVYFFLERTIFKDKADLPKKLASFLGGAFYLLNLGTVQHFYVPFEMFTMQYAALPWLFLLATKFLLNGGVKYLFWFGLITLLATPMAYAATLWYVYFTALLIYGLIFFRFRRLVLIILTTLLINSFWLLPNLYFLINNGAQVSQAKINQMFSEKAFLSDSAYATFDNAVLLKGFLFDWQEYQDGKFVTLLDEWQKHLENPAVLDIGWLLFGFVVLGVVTSILNPKRSRIELALLPVFAFSFIFLIHAHPPISYLFSFMRDHSSIFNEGLRFPWTKFSIVVIFCYAFYFAQAIFWLLHLLRKRWLVLLVSFLLTMALFIWVLPMFSGNLISKSMRVNIPAEYFETFNWFNKQPNGRIATFPVYTFWGWEYYKWGFQGAGFTSFGLPQSVLVRDFDRWSPYNENFYWEISFAVYSKNLKLLEDVLEKYQVQWLLVDENVFNPVSSKSVYFDELREILSGSTKISREQSFGRIEIYRVNLDTRVNNSVIWAENLPTIGSDYKWTNQDQAYTENKNYISASGADDYYPFRSLFTGRNQQDVEFSVEDKGDYFLFKKELPQTLEGYYLEIPEIKDEDLEWIDPNDLGKIRNLLSHVEFNGKVIEVRVPKVGGYLSAQINSVDYSDIQTKNCDTSNRGQVETEPYPNFLRISALDTTNCSAYFPQSVLPHKFAYLITAKVRNVEGRNFLFWLENLNSRKADIETYLEGSKLTIAYFVQPPMEHDGIGYALHFDSVSIGQRKTVNDFIGATVNPIPYNFLMKLKLTKVQKIKNTQLVSIDSISHPNPSFYFVPTYQNLASQSSTLILSQSYDEGWRAYVIESSESKIKNFLNTALPIIFGKEIKNHVLVNNWENGWIIDSKSISSNSQLVLVYQPQYLEFLGLFFAIGWIGMLGFVYFKYSLNKKYV